MNIFIALQIIGWTAFSIIVFAVVVNVLTNATKQIVREIYACKTTMLKLMDDSQEVAQAVNERIAAEALAKR